MFIIALASSQVRLSEQQGDIIDALGDEFRNAGFHVGPSRAESAAFDRGGVVRERV